jgi:hypothetical protein
VTPCRTPEQRWGEPRVLGPRRHLAGFYLAVTSHIGRRGGGGRVGLLDRCASCNEVRSPHGQQDMRSVKMAPRPVAGWLAHQSLLHTAVPPRSLRRAQDTPRTHLVVNTMFQRR